MAVGSALLGEGVGDGVEEVEGVGVGLGTEAVATGAELLAGADGLGAPAGSAVQPVRARPAINRTMPLRRVMPVSLAGVGKRSMILLGLVVTACSPGPPELVYVDVPVTAAPAQISRAECPRDGAGVLDLYGHGRSRGRTPGMVPAGFVGTVVIRCDIEWDIHTPLSGGQARVRLDQSEGPATADLLAALALPDQGVLTGEPCSGAAGQPPYLLLVDEGRRSIRPYLPTTYCGDLRPEAWAAIQGLALTRTGSFTFMTADR